MSYRENGNSLSVAIIRELRNSSVSSIDKQDGRVTLSTYTYKRGWLPLHAASETYLLVIFPFFINNLLQINLVAGTVAYSFKWMGD